MTDVVDVINSQYDFTRTAVSDAQTFLAALASLASADNINLVALPETNYVNNGDGGIAATLFGFRPVAPAVPRIIADLPTFIDSIISTLPDVTVPDFDKAAPVLTIPDAPSGALPTPPVAPSISDPVIPSAPDITFPTAPTIVGITLPDAPSISIPTFSSILPDDDLITPSNTFTFNEELYQSALLDELKLKLLNDLENGSYGIEPLDEAGLWSRARDRESEAASADMDELYVNSAARGFALQPGDLNIALQRARQFLASKLASIEREITLKRGDLFVQARQFTFEQVKGLEQVLIGFHNSIMERALNAAKATLEASIEIFKTQVLRYNARLEAYKTEAQVFEARIRAQLAQVEVYRTTMEGKRIESDIQRNVVSLYTAQLEAVNTVVNVYKTRLEAASIQAGIERIRLESFRALIDAFTSQVQAKVAEFNMYDSRIRGEISKMQAYQVEVQAYTSKVAGAKTKSDILIARLQSEIAKGNQRIEEFKARVDQYRANLQGQQANVAAILSGYGSDIEAYKATAGAAAESLRLVQSSHSLDYGTNLKAAEQAIEKARLTFEGIVQQNQLKVSATSSGAQISGNIVAGSMNAINALVTLAGTQPGG